jgi:hypothetical protein
MSNDIPYPPTPMDQRTLDGELILARAILVRLLDELEKPDSGAAQLRVVVPLLFRGIKLVADLLKQLGGDGQDGTWDEVLDRLGDELDVEL